MMQWDAERTGIKEKIMSEKIVLIDGHSILNRAFYGLPDLTNSEGLHTNAVYGFLNILFKIIEEEKPQYLTVAFDLSAPTFRHKMFDGYKGTRKPPVPEFREQVPLMKEVLGAMGVACVQMEGYEADDLLGTIAKRSEAKGLDVAVISGDRDLLQLATDRIKIRIPKTKAGKTIIEDYYEQQVQELYGVTPTEFIDVKALMGDPSDNIPGIPGVGEKTASKIIAQYHSIENAYAHVDEIKPNKAKESLRDNYDKAVLSKTLAAIQTDSPLEYSWEDSAIGNLYTAEAYELFRRLEFKNLLGKFDGAIAEGQKDHIEESFKIIEEKKEADKLLKQLKKETALGIQIQAKDGQLSGLILSGEDGTFCFKAEEEEYEQLALFQMTPAKEEIISSSYLRNQLQMLSESCKNISVIDLKKILKHVKINEESVFDVSLGAYLLNPLKSAYSYDDLAKEYLGAMLYQKDTTEDYRACYEAYVARQVKDKLETALKEAEMYQLYKEIELPLVYVLDHLEKEGILADRQALVDYGEQLYVRIQELEGLIWEEAGEKFNINSPKQLGVILFEKMGLPGGKKTKTGYSTAADILEKLAPDHKIITHILEYRQLTKLKSTYADGLSSCIQEDGRIHSTFNQTITATGRISSTEPNLQNIPMRMELGRLIRKCFVPKPGFVFLDADYSQIELRVLAHMSGDENLIQAYQEAEDIHRITASKVFHVPFEEVTDLQRRNAKAVNFGIVYGISSFGLAQDLSITTKEAAKYIQDYFATYPGIKKFLDDLVAQGKEQGYVTTMFGRRRPIPELSSSNFMQRSFGERIAMNSPIQGTAADIIKIAMNRVHRRLTEGGYESSLILQVHDELLIEAKIEELEEVKAILAEEMVGAAKLSVKLEIDMHTGSSWYEAK